MKALSVRQPWAWLLFHGKPVENRDWTTGYKRPLAIHSSVGMTVEEYEDAVEFCKPLSYLTTGLIPPMRELPRGCVVGIVEQVGCVERHPSPFFQGRYGHVYENQREFLRPCPARGALGLWEWSPVGGIEQYWKGRPSL